MERIGIIGAMEVEVALLREKMRKTGELNAVSEGGLTFYNGSLGGKNVTLVKSGVGKVNAEQNALSIQELPELRQAAWACSIWLCLRMQSITIWTQRRSGTRRAKSRK